MPSSEDIVKYTQMLGLINGMIPIGIQLGVTLTGVVKNAIASNRAAGDPTTVAEAQAALDQFEKITSQTHQIITDWLQTHPPIAVPPATSGTPD